MSKVVDEAERAALLDKIMCENNCITDARKGVDLLKLCIKQQQSVVKMHLARKAVYVLKLSELDKKAAK